MCGIYGFIGFKDDKLLRGMGESLAHRGPDDQAEYNQGDISLGYRRLAIIDVKGSFQPLFNEDKSIALVYNGEIYNYQELRRELSTHKFRTDGDGETIIHWYEEQGEEGFKDLNGMFGFALFDEDKNRVLLVRDHFGIKPLYYSEFEGKIVFASEIKAMLPVLRKLGMEIRPDETAVSRYLLRRVHDNDERTFFEGIKRVPAGGLVEVNMRNKGDRGNWVVEGRNYWKTTKKEWERSEKEAVEKFRELFLDSVRMRLMSEVPLGTALSGGLDSSAVVCAVARLLKDQTQETGEERREWRQVVGVRQRTFSAVFPGEVNNEKEYIDEVTKETGVVNFQVEPKREEMWKDLEKVIYHQDEPMISTGPYAQWKVMELAAKQKMKVLLDGQGADEMLAGYDPYFIVYLKELFRSLKWLRLLKELFLGGDRIWSLVRNRGGTNMEDLFNFEGSLNKGNLRDWGNRGLNERLENDVFKNSLPALLRYEDRNSMAFSIESRVPFLDYRLWDLVNSLGPEYKIRNGWNKWIMREALRGILPEKIRTRRWKVGFTTPEVAWMRQSAKEVDDIFQSESFRQRKYFKADKIEKAYKDFLAEKNDESMIFWRIINVELWMRIFIDKE